MCKLGWHLDDAITVLSEVKTAGPASVVELI